MNALSYTNYLVAIEWTTMDVLRLCRRALAYMVHFAAPNLRVVRFISVEH